MKYNFDVDKIVNYLKPLKDDLSELYSWKFKLEKLTELKVIDENYSLKLNQLSPFDREIILKDIINNMLHKSHKENRDLFDKLSLWVIKDWGGIKTAKDENTKELITSFMDGNKIGYKRIASTSKVASFMYPDKYIIYDSRVAYSLNWILLSQKASDIYFPIPDGRNSKMTALDMNVLIRIKNIDNYSPKVIEEMDNKKYISSKDKMLYIPESESYMELNKLIKDVNSRLWDEDKSNKLFYTEMLLFSIADREIFKDITEKISLQLNW